MSEDQQGLPPVPAPNEGGSGPAPTSKELQREINRVILENLPSFALGMAILYLIFAFLHITTLSQPIALWMTLIAVISACFCALLAFWLLPKIHSPRLAHPMALLLATIILSNSLAHLHFTQEPHQTSNVMLVIVGSGFFFLSWPWLAGIIVLSVLSWGVVIAQFDAEVPLLHYGVALFTATVVSFLMHAIRRRTLGKLELLVLKDRAQKDELENALAEARKAQALAERAHSEAVKAVQREQASREEVHRREVYFRALLENASDGVSSVDAKGNISYFSAPAQRILGYLPAEIIGQSSFDFIHPDDLEKARVAFAELLSQRGKVNTTELRIRTKRGGWHIIESTAQNLLHDPRIGCIVVNFRDVTERRRLEERLFQVQKMEAIGRLAGGIAHDFNNLLTAISGYTELLGKRLESQPDLLDNVNEIKKSVDWGGLLARQLLAFGRKQALQLEVLDLNQVIHEMEEIVKKFLTEKIKLELKLQSGLGRIRADRLQIKNVILNLVINAHDAMPEGGTLQIETSNTTISSGHNFESSDIEPGAYVQLSIADTGIGMDAETRSHIFEPFFSTKEAGAGTGLGLSSVYGLVKQSNGFVEVESAPGCGTRMTIFLPQYQGKESAGDRASNGASKNGKATILLVEDDRAVRDVTARLLQQTGYAVLTAENGDEAIQCIKQHKGTIDLMISDMVMPGMSGRELAQTMQTLCPEIKVLFISGYIDESAFEPESPGNQAGFLRKPFDIDVLKEKIRTILHAGS